MSPPPKCVVAYSVRISEAMRDIRVATAQFEHRNNDKAYNLARIEELTRRAVEKGAEIVSFHECSISGYTFLQHLSRDELAALAEPVPGGRPSRARADRPRRTASWSWPG